MGRPSSQRPSLATVAAKVGVSTATVSNSFNRPEKVSSEVLARVLAEAARQRYVGPDPAARLLSRGRTDTLGLLFTGELAHAFHDPAAVAFLQGLSISCRNAGLNLLLISSEGSGDQRTAVANAVVDGFVVYSVSPQDAHLKQILDRQLPTVVVDSPTDVPGVDWVGAADRTGARALGQMLVTAGHRRIGVITAGVGSDVSGHDDRMRLENEPESVSGNRILGLLDALAPAGIADLWIEARPDNIAHAGGDALDSLLNRCRDLTAVCALMDVLAFGALKAARERGLSVPQQLTITGFDDVPQAATVGLTTVNQPLVDKGRVAGELYLSRRPGTPPRRRILSTSLRVRATSGPPLG